MPAEPLAARRYALIGVSNRGVASFARPLLGVAGGTDSVLGYGASADDFSARGRLVAVLDVDRARAEAFTRAVVPAGYPQVAVYSPDELGSLFDQARPDAVIIASPDHTHSGYIEAALSRGVDVISEKPMVTTAAEAARVLAAQEGSVGTVRVTHNLRYTARHRRIKELLLAGAVGRVLHVALDYRVDVRHGASYFLRWNRTRAASGGLTIHKSTHHLDLIAWWLGQRAATAYALGGRDYYGPAGAHRPAGVPADAPVADVRAADPYYRAQLGSGTFPDDAATARRGLFDLPYDVQYPAGRDLYLYDEEIDIEDHVSALLTFDGGASAAYSVTFSSPWEGYRATITGTHGVIEAFTGRTPEGEQLAGSGELVLRPLFAQAEQISVASGSGGHDGADPLMRRDLFVGPDEESVRLGLGASAVEGAFAVAAGEAVWRSVAEQRVVSVPELLGR